MKRKNINKDITREQTGSKAMQSAVLETINVLSDLTTIISNDKNYQRSYEKFLFDQKIALYQLLEKADLTTGDLKRFEDHLYLELSSIYSKNKIKAQAHVSPRSKKKVVKKDIHINVDPVIYFSIVENKPMTDKDKDELKQTLKEGSGTKARTVGVFYDKRYLDPNKRELTIYWVTKEDKLANKLVNNETLINSIGRVGIKEVKTEPNLNEIVPNVITLYEYEKIIPDKYKIKKAYWLNNATDEISTLNITDELNDDRKKTEEDFIQQIKNEIYVADLPILKTVKDEIKTVSSNKRPEAIQSGKIYIVEEDVPEKMKVIDAYWFNQEQNEIKIEHAAIKDDIDKSLLQIKQRLLTESPLSPLKKLFETEANIRELNEINKQRLLTESPPIPLEKLFEIQANIRPLNEIIETTCPEIIQDKIVKNVTVVNKIVEQHAQPIIDELLSSIHPNKMDKDNKEIKSKIEQSIKSMNDRKAIEIKEENFDRLQDHENKNQIEAIKNKIKLYQEKIKTIIDENLRQKANNQLLSVEKDFIQLEQFADIIRHDVRLDKDVLNQIYNQYEKGIAKRQGLRKNEDAYQYLTEKHRIVKEMGYLERTIMHRYVNVKFTKDGEGPDTLYLINKPTNGLNRYAIKYFPLFSDKPTYIQLSLYQSKIIDDFKENKDAALTDEEQEKIFAQKVAMIAKLSPEVSLYNEIRKDINSTLQVLDRALKDIEYIQLAKSDDDIGKEREKIKNAYQENSNKINTIEKIINQIKMTDAQGKQFVEQYEIVMPAKAGIQSSNIQHKELFAGNIPDALADKLHEIKQKNENLNIDAPSKDLLSNLQAISKEVHDSIIKLEHECKNRNDQNNKAINDYKIDSKNIVASLLKELSESEIKKPYDSNVKEIETIDQLLIDIKSKEDHYNENIERHASMAEKLFEKGQTLFNKIKDGSYRKLTEERNRLSKLNTDINNKASTILINKNDNNNLSNYSHRHCEETAFYAVDEAIHHQEKMDCFAPAKNAGLAMTVGVVTNLSNNNDSLEIDLNQNLERCKKINEKIELLKQLKELSKSIDHLHHDCVTKNINDDNRNNAITNKYYNLIFYNDFKNEIVKLNTYETEIHHALVRLNADPILKNEGYLRFYERETNGLGLPAQIAAIEEKDKAVEANKAIIHKESKGYIQGNPIPPNDLNTISKLNIEMNNIKTTIENIEKNP